MSLGDARGRSSQPTNAAARRTHRTLALGSGALLLLTFLALLLVARGAVVRAGTDLLLAEARVAAALHAETGDAGAVETLLGGRARVEPVAGDGLDRPVVTEGPGGRPVARVALYDRDRWTVVGTLEVVAPAESASSIPGWLWRITALGGLLVVAVCGGWARRRVSGSGGSATSGAGAGLVAGAAALTIVGALAVTGGVAWRWADARLVELTDLRMDLGADALAAVPDAEGLIARPGGATSLTGLAFVDARAADDVAFSTLLPATARTLAALPRPLPDRVEVERAPWAVTEAEGVILARTPYEHTEDPGGRLLGTGIVGLLLGLLPVSLAPLAGRRRELRRNLVAWGFLAPAGLHLAVFTLGPLAFALWLSLHEWTLVDPARPFVGLSNYLGLLADGAFWNAIANTAVFTLHVPVAMAMALAFAILVHGRTRGVAVVRAALFLPSITSLVAIAVVWQWMLNDQYGLLNWLLDGVGLDPVPWLTSPRTALPAIMLLSTWIVVGYQMVLFQAGLAAIPEELYHAARIDGAGAWSRFWHVTLPGLRHTLFFVLVTSVIGSFQVFGAVYVMTEGGPLGSTDVAVYHIYREAWEFLRFGNAAAMSWVLFALIFAVTWLHFRLLERRGQEGAA